MRSAASTVPSRQAAPRKTRGFSKFELVICLLFMLVVGSSLYSRYMTLVVDAEQAAIRGVIGWLQAGINVRMSLAVTSGDLNGLRGLEGSNPMVLVARVMEPPSNYLGELAGDAAQRAARGSWYFDTERRVLVYRLQYQATAEGFTQAADQRLAFRLKLRYQAADIAGGAQIRGLALEAVAAEDWQRMLREPLS